MYELVLKFNTLAELQAHVAAIGAVPNGGPKASGKGATAAQPSPSPSPAAPSPAASAPPPPAPKAPKYEDSGIGEMLKTASQDAGKKTKAVDLLKEFGAVKEGKVSGQHLDPAKFDEFKAKLQAVLDAKEEESIA
jgi:hypothetical protein